jgi:hypothetical protein
VFGLFTFYRRFCTANFLSEIKYLVNLEWNILQILTRNDIFFYDYSNWVVLSFNFFKFILVAVSQIFDRVKCVALWSANIRKLAKDHKGCGSQLTAATTTSDEFWDRGLEDNPQFPISVAPAIDEIVDGSRQVFAPSVSNRPSSVTGPNNSSGSQLTLTRPQAKTTHTFSRPIDTTIPSYSMAPSDIRSNEFYRSRWPTNYLYPPNQTIPSFAPYSLTRDSFRLFN